MAPGAGQPWSDERSAAGKRSPWLIVGVASIATFMEVLDGSIANVSLRHIAGSLSVSEDEATWVLTSYLVANAVIIPVSGWLSNVIGRKRYFMISVAFFTLSSLVCALAPSLTWLIIGRVLQGIGGGGLAPLEQSFIADSFPPKKRGQAFAAYAVVVVLGPVMGPTVGGFITESLSWHWIFLINVPIGLLSLLLVGLFICESPLLERERRERLRRGLNVDYIGFALVALGLGCMSIALDRGERSDWFASEFITVTAVIAAVSLVAFCIWELNHKDPIIKLRLFANRNFAIASMLMLTAGVIIFGSTQLIPQMLQQVQGYTALNAGLALTTGGVATLLMMPMVGLAAGRIDPRMLLFTGLAVEGLALWNISRFSPDIAFGDIAVGRMFQTIGLPLLFVPINTIAFVGLKPSQTADASALLNVARNLGGTLGISVATTFLLNRQQVHQSQMMEGLNPLNPSYNEGIGRIVDAIGQHAAAAPLLLYQQAQEQALMLAYLDVFRAFMIFVFVIMPLAMFLRSASRGRAAIR